MGAVGRFLRSGSPLPNAAKPPPFPEPAVFRNEGGRIDWHATLSRFTASIAELGAPELAQGLGRFIEVVVEASGGHPDFSETIALLELGSRDSMVKAYHDFAALEETLRAWSRSTLRGRPLYSPAGEDEPPNGHERFLPGIELVFGVRHALSAARARFVNPSYRDAVTFDLRPALYYLLTAMMDFRSELSASEALVIAHRLLDPAARQAAPGGLWSETKRKGTSVVVLYGRGEDGLLTAKYTLDTLTPSYRGLPRHRLDSIQPTKGTLVDDVDYESVLADLIRRRVRQGDLYPSNPRASAALERAGFTRRTSHGITMSDSEILDEAADYWVISHPRTGQ